MITSDSVIDSLGGTKAVASALSLALPTVSGWRVRGIPSTHWLALVKLASEHNVPAVTLEALAKLDAPEAAETAEVRP